MTIKTNGDVRMIEIINLRKVLKAMRQWVMDNKPVVRPINTLLQPMGLRVVPFTIKYSADEFQECWLETLDDKRWVARVYLNPSIRGKYGYLLEAKSDVM